MNRGHLLAAVTIVFVLGMALIYLAALQDPKPPPQQVATAPPETGPETQRSRLKAPPKKAPPKRRSTTPRFASPGRGGIGFSLDDEGEPWAPNEHRIEGRVLGERSRPVAGARVTYRSDGKRRTTKADEEGRFEITARGTRIILQAERKDGLFTVRSEPVVIEGEGGEWEVDLVLETKPYGGLGVGVAKHRDGLRIRSVIEGGPASVLSLSPGDIILEAGGNTLAGLSTRQASDLLIGPDGSTQTVKVRHGDGAEGIYTFHRQHMEK
jgi:hypothetical protein